jgi:hypothetical protein
MNQDPDHSAIQILGQEKRTISTGFIIYFEQEEYAGD